jgi:drug/metabolite transporter (DMT)-like permease
MPIFSTLLGVVALGEPLTWYEPIGAAIVIAEAALAQSHDRSAPAPGRAEARLSLRRSRRRSPARSRTSGW